ncbi:hypothetical protein Mp_5g07380 [Marchantia polymorpha subsp. ruderalis]|uniref:Uncharacterized protein n=2 Tax=Marchantia polymorpha TaxID=3197 RepID=A0AAF6BFW5_MARPO|nr:hypothetical protein MARPO_0127s0048 [Marchantia polymorpha]BBN10899.1 hypothetical protein Mp_5g07380 [Marchantia polymorpha subsp. ruderalis]|eukprot:PTQ30267.1 hypothetical protein MARPO_0127s0048 [Marchantia polymorpha]
MLEARRGSQISPDPMLLLSGALASRDAMRNSAPLHTKPQRNATRAEPPTGNLQTTHNHAPAPIARAARSDTNQTRSRKPRYSRMDQPLLALGSRARDIGTDWRQQQHGKGRDGEREREGDGEREKEGEGEKAIRHGQRGMAAAAARAEMSVARWSDEDDEVGKKQGLPSVASELRAGGGATAEARCQACAAAFASSGSGSELRSDATRCSGSTGGAEGSGAGLEVGQEGGATAIDFASGLGPEHSILRACLHRWLQKTGHRRDRGQRAPTASSPIL